MNASGRYDILLGEKLIGRTGELLRPLVKAEKAVVVSDSNVAPLYADTVCKSLESAGFATEIFVFPAGEESKSPSTLLSLYDFLAEKGVTRSDVLLALGGGVTGDLTGFCAATYLRGIDYVQLPTSLLAQVDSSIGGKTAVDIAAGKNLVGAFKQPILVIADTDTLTTLPAGVFTDGMGEVVKYGMIRSKPLFERLSRGNAREGLADIIAQCMEIKRDVVERDEKDIGERMILNFGHTIGHAIEKYHGFGGLSHGKCVAEGMYMITALAEKKGLCEKGTSEKLLACLEANELPYADEITADEILALSHNDKKRAGNSVRIVVCPDIGESKILTLSADEYEAFLKAE